MDLSLTRFDRAVAVCLPAQFALLMVGVAARQAASVTARAQAIIDARAADCGRFAPAHGCFSFAVARDLVRWREE